MSMHFKETTPEGWDDPVVELWDDDEFVGQVYFDGVDVMTQIYPTPDGEPRVFEVAELLRVVELAAKVIEPDDASDFADLRSALGVEPGDGDDGKAVGDDLGPVGVLADAFDDAAAHRGEEDEGFYPRTAAAAMVGRCNDLDLAVVNLEGFDLEDGYVEPAKGYAVDIGKAHRGEPWPTFRAGCNVQAEAVLEGWPVRPTFVIAVEIQDRDGEIFVM